MVGFGMRSINDKLPLSRGHERCRVMGRGFFKKGDVWRWEQDPMDSFPQLCPGGPGI